MNKYYKAAFMVGFGFYAGKHTAEILDRVLFHVWKGCDMDDKIYAKAKQVSKAKTGEAEHVEMGFHA